jgi:transcriptional regulator with XRE-family HTH domain
METFAEKLKAARTAAGLTQHSMADRMLIPFRTIQQWEGGQRTPPEYVQRFVLNELEGLKIVE